MAKALHRPDPDLYERDFHAWLVEQAGHARAGRIEAPDLENIAEELEGLARSEHPAIEGRMDRLVTRLLKLGYVRDQGPRRGWVLTVNEQRRRIRRLIAASPSLAGYPARVLDDAPTLRRSRTWRGNPASPQVRVRRGARSPSSGCSTDASCRRRRRLGAAHPAGDRGPALQACAARLVA
jgi:hypothetical protein